MCSVEGCNRDVLAVAKKLCRIHYKRLLKFGEVGEPEPRKGPGKPIPHGTPSGYRYHKCRCDDCRTAASMYHKRFDRQNNSKKARKAKIDQIKMDSGCIECGYNEHPAALDFDHVRGEKLFNISTGLSTVGFNRIMEEIEKCEVVCANHHRVRTFIRANNPT